VEICLFDNTAQFYIYLLIDNIRDSVDMRFVVDIRNITLLKLILNFGAFEYLTE